MEKDLDKQMRMVNCNSIWKKNLQTYHRAVMNLDRLTTWKIAIKNDRGKAIEKTGCVVWSMFMKMKA